MNKWKTICFVLIIISITVLFMFFNQKTSYQSQFATLINNHSRKIDTLSFYEPNFLSSFFLDGEKVNDVICEQNENQTVLSELVKDKPVLVYHFSDQICGSCVDELLNVVTSCFYERKDRVLILCSYPNLDFFSVKRTFNIRLPFYQVSYDAFGDIMDKTSHFSINDHFFFILNPDMKISHIYIPNNDYSDLNKQYIERMKKLLE